MKQRKWVKKQAVLMILLCLLAQGCTKRESRDPDKWSFQVSQAETAFSDGDGTGMKSSEEDFTAGENGGHFGDGDMDSGKAAGKDVSGASGETAGEDGSGAPGETAGEDGSGVSGEEDVSAGYVYVCGAVRHPGVYEIREDTRIFEVLQLAGGLTENADPDWLNQAQPVSDGQKLQVYTKEETELMRSSGMAAGDMTGLSGGTETGDMTGPQGGQGAGDHENSPGTGGAAGDASDDKININTADREELMTLPGIGEARADAIVKYRQEHGPFGAIEEICQVSGIKEAVFSDIKDRITV